MRYDFLYHLPELLFFLCLNKLMKINCKNYKFKLRFCSLICTAIVVVALFCLCLVYPVSLTRNQNEVELDSLK